MGLGVAEKIIYSHLISGTVKKGSEIALHIDQTLTQDATGTMAYLQFEAMGIDRVRTEKSVAYIDHNMLQSGFENADDHRYIQTVAKKHGIWFSRPGNGICHQVHLERFAVPGKTLIGSDSHTPTAGGLGMLAFGAGGLDVAVAMGGGAYYINMPEIVRVELTGKLRPFVTAKDVSLELLRRISVKGGVGKIMEWGGEGIKTLSVPERATITNMGTETGATTSVFPSDDNTLEFLKAQGREKDFVRCEADDDAKYSEIITIDLSELEPMIACPHQPDNVVKVSEVSGNKVDQVCIGSCTNSSLSDMLKCANMLKGRKISDNVSMSVSCGSKQVLSMLSECGALSDILASGARLLECGCGPCIGMGFSPNSGGISLRSFNRNFEGRSGTRDAKVYLVSPETACASALTGVITDPRTLGINSINVPVPGSFTTDDSAILEPALPEEAKNIAVIKGPNIKSVPVGERLPDTLSLPVSLKAGDNITTDHIMPAGSKILPFRSNIPKMSDFCFSVCDPAFPERARELGRSIVIGGVNYGQGSSREHAALVPLYLGVRAVIAKSFARIHRANLINAGILPLVFENASDYDLINEGNNPVITNIKNGLKSGRIIMELNGKEITLLCELSERQRSILYAGGLLNLTREENK
ncbi:MAG: aconitate hydratase [Oscillospiraceae bacterium]|nr:aconitate hydratase [Oscillospiraceae bacterium]